MQDAGCAPAYAAKERRSRPPISLPPPLPSTVIKAEAQRDSPGRARPLSVNGRNGCYMSRDSLVFGPNAPSGVSLVAREASDEGLRPLHRLDIARHTEHFVQAAIRLGGQTTPHTFLL
ncbi:hypothetical protein NDU88_006537 [Pleurodeles waltl]|uniref:Uncharacterized protein n=1 Tax=Pleurodeles waltl TaxID=8319 RepID=A0AAV7LPE2_PLEWA|nr:hypothetical protein NDU88_006537 [Pleurodeles waltl]